MFNTFEKGYLSLLKRFLFLSIHRLYFIQVLHKIYMEKVLQQFYGVHFLGRPYHSNGSKIHLDAALHYSRNKSLQQKSQLLTVQKQLLEVFCKKRCSQKLRKILRKTPAPNNVAGLRPQTCNFIKKEALAELFFCKFCKISKNIYSTEHLRTTASGLLLILYT